MIRTKPVLKEVNKKDKKTGKEYIIVKEVNVKCDFPEFMKYTKEIKYTKNGKERPYEKVKEEKDKIKNRIDKSLVCPMNWLEEILSEIQMSSTENTVPTENFFIKMDGKANNRQMSKIVNLIEDYDKFYKSHIENEDDIEMISEKYRELIEKIKSIKIGNPVTINRLIETSLDIETVYKTKEKNPNSKYTRKILNCLYKASPDKFLNNFKKA